MELSLHFPFWHNPALDSHVISQDFIILSDPSNTCTSHGLNSSMTLMPFLSAPGVVRVQDYLNDKFQTLADLDTLDSLLSSVQHPKQQRHSPHEPADSAVESSRAALNSHSQKLAAAVNDFQNVQAGIDRRLLAT